MGFYMCQKPWKQKYKIFLENLNTAERDLWCLGKQNTKITSLLQFLLIPDIYCDFYFKTSFKIIKNPTKYTFFLLK